VFENRVLRRMFGQKRDEMMGGWITVHNEELRELYSSPGIIKNKVPWPLVRKRTIPTERSPLVGEI
jgi:hypothetical protein